MNYTAPTAQVTSSFIKEGFSNTFFTDFSVRWHLSIKRTHLHLCSRPMGLSTLLVIGSDTACYRWEIDSPGDKETAEMGEEKVGMRGQDDLMKCVMMYPLKCS